MTKVIVDTNTAEQLSKARGAIEFFDASGRSLGRFERNLDVDNYDGYECPYSDETLDRIEQNGGGRPLRDILRDLESRA